MPTSLLHRYRFWMCCLLITVLPNLGLSLAQSQSLGSLHSHHDTTAHVSVMQQVMQQVMGWWMNEVRAQVHNSRHARARAESHNHPHNDWQRHHHEAGDTSVVGLEPVGQDAAAQAQMGGLSLPLLGSPAAPLRLLVRAGTPGAWPHDMAVRFGSRSTLPPLRPPRGA